MSLIPLTDRVEIRSAFDTLAAHLKRHARPYTRKVGWHGGGGEFPVYWRPEEQIWCMFEPDREKTRYWCCFGTSDPANANNLTIVGEINPTKDGVNRRNAGVFVRDEYGVVYIAHSGKLGGGRPGIGKSAFLRAYRGDNVEDIDWPDDYEGCAIVIGRIDGPHLPAQIAHFIREVERFKNEAVTGAGPLPPPPGSFNPEFSGVRKGYTYAGVIEARCDHGLVIDALAEFAAARDLRFSNDGRRDFFLIGPDGEVSHLFEAKSEISTTSLYTAIGQLMLLGAAQPKRPKLVLVLPDKPGVETADALRRLGLIVLTYEWDGAKPVLHRPEKVL